MGQESPQPGQAVEQGSAGAQGSGQRRGFTGAAAQIDRPFQLGLEGLADFCGGGLQLSAADSLSQPLVPAVKQLPLQAEQRLADLSRDAAALGYGDQIAADVGPAELALLQRQAVTPSARKVEASSLRPLQPPGGLMEPFNASLQRGRQS
jgi:hypothetical protein